MDDPTRSLRMDHRHGEAWERYGNVYGEPGYTVPIRPMKPRASFEQRFFVVHEPGDGLEIRDRHAEATMCIYGYFEKGVEPDDYAAEICKRLNRSCERASFDTRRWLVYGAAIAAVVAWWVLW